MTVTLKRLDHVNLRTADLDAMVAWYGRILDMHPGPRPGFSFPGAWLYADGHPILHLVGVDTAPGADASELRLEHFAIAATGLKQMLAALKADGALYRHTLGAAAGLRHFLERSRPASAGRPADQSPLDGSRPGKE